MDSFGQRLRRWAGRLRHSPVFKIAALYLLAGGLWILFSDQCLLWLVGARTVRELTVLQTYKGWFFIAASTGLLAVLVHYFVSSIQRSESQLKEAKEVAESANKAKDRFLAVLSHELRTPLTPALAGVRALMDEPEGAMREATLEMIQRNIELEARLVDDLLDVMRIGRDSFHLNLGTVDAHALLRQTLEICRADAQNGGLRLVCDLSATEWHVRGDSMRLQQVFWNLLKNAIKFTPRGGQITIRSSMAAADASGRPELLIEFSDSGIGIAPDAMRRIFEPFQQADDTIPRRFGGLGLGLTISRAIIRAHGGRIEAASAGPGQGATFSVRLAMADAPQAVAVSPAPLAAAAAGPIRILLVDDHNDTLLILARLLRRRGYQVTTAADIRSAMVACRERFDLLISDVGLPDGDGREILGRAGGAGRIPGIILSGLGTEEDIRRSMEAGFDEHMTKPVDFGRLEAAIQRLVGARGSRAGQGK